MIALVVEKGTGVVVNTIVVEHLQAIEIPGHVLHEHPKVSSKDGSFVRHLPVTTYKTHFVKGRLVEEDGTPTKLHPNTVAHIKSLDEKS